MGIINILHKGRQRQISDQIKRKEQSPDCSDKRTGIRSIR